MKMTTVYGKLKRKGRVAFSSEEFKESGGGSRGKGAPVLHRSILESSL
jgi:hypothetical protein